MHSRRWLAPVAVGLIGLGLSSFAFWLADTAEDRRIRNVLALRSEWRARDLEAKIRLSGNAVENVAIAMAANPSLDAAWFDRMAKRARRDLTHVNALQWAPRVRNDQIAAFEESARAAGLQGYRVFEVTPDFQPAELTDRAEYFPVLHDVRFHGRRPALGLALGKYEGRAVPMAKARDEGRPVATLPVRPIGPPTPNLVYLLFWPVYDGIDIPATPEGRRERLRGFAVGNYDVAALLTAAFAETPEPTSTIYFAIAAESQASAAGRAAVVYVPEARRVVPVAQANAPAETPAIRIEHHFIVFGQHWDLTFDYAPAIVAGMRSQGAWGWLLAGLLLTASLAFYLVRERGRTAAIEALVAERTVALERAGAQLHQAQKMEAIGNLTGGMAHDFNNLLSVVIGNLDLLRDRFPNDADALARIDAALHAGTRGAELTRQLLAYARRQPLDPRPTDVNQLVAGMTRMLERILEEHIEVALVTAPDVWPVIIDAAQLSSAIINLATNARDAMPQGGRLTIETRNAHLDADYAALNPDVAPGDYVLLEVSDTGTGIPPDTLAQVFEPFFTTKEAGKGTGLGLSMVFGFVKQSRGHVKIYSEVGQGTTVRLYLPRATTAAPVPAEPQAAPVPARRGGESILVVEDDTDVRRTVTGQLTDLGYAVVEAAGPQAALALVQDSAMAIDLLFTDLVMPGGMNGHELARAALAVRPGLKVLYTSGYAGSALRNDDRLKAGEHFLGKPYRRHDLARKLEEIFER